LSARHTGPDPMPNANKTTPSAHGLPALTKRRGPQHSQDLASRRSTDGLQIRFDVQSLGPTAFRFVWFQDASSRIEKNLLPVASGRNLVTSRLGVNPLPNEKRLKVRLDAVRMPKRPCRAAYRANFGGPGLSCPSCHRTVQEKAHGFLAGFRWRKRYLVQLIGAQ
jgi:hypothetical protein